MNNLVDNLHTDVYANIKRLMENARTDVAKQVNNILVKTYWEIGRIIVEDEQGHSDRAEYGKSLIADLSKKLTKEYGKGFSKSNLFYMRSFYLTYPIFQTLSGKLSWSHYLELLSIDDKNKRSFYEKETVNANWSVRELKRQINTSLFERLLLSSGDDLEKALVTHIEKFLLELGKGFMYVGSQQRVTLGNTHYYVDMVFYNKILRSYVLIELKTGKLMPEAVGQLNMYLNYYKTEVNDEIDNEPIGIILCANKDSIQAEYALGSLSNQIFASKYTLYIPDREQLEEQVERVVKKYKKK